MTLRDYISEKLRAYGLSDVNFVDLAMQTGIDPDADINVIAPDAVGKALICMIEECILAPRLNNASEGGFSISYNYDNVGKYYLWLCHKWKVTPSREMAGLIGVSSIVDVSDLW